MLHLFSIDDNSNGVLSRLLVGLGNGILTSSVYIVEVVAPDNRGSVVMVRDHMKKRVFKCADD